MILMGLLILIISALAIAVVYPIISAPDYAAIDANFGGSYNSTSGEWSGTTPAHNASLVVLSTTGTVMGLNPLAALVAVAAGIITLLLGAFIFGGGRAPKL